METFIKSISWLGMLGAIGKYIWGGFQRKFKDRNREVHLAEMLHADVETTVERIVSFINSLNSMTQQNNQTVATSAIG